MDVMDALIPSDANELAIVNVLSHVSHAYGSESFLVGGYVRDLLLGRPSKDIDVVVLGSGIDLAHKVADALQPKPSVSFYSRYGTAMLKYRDLEIEFVGARKESYTPESRNPVVENGTLEDDQNRRDFTINALAVDLQPGRLGKLLDPFGGLEDLQNGIIRTPADADKTFSDDPLRMMRAIRFACQLGFIIEEKTWEGIVNNKERIRIISQERITTEMEKMLASPQPSVGFELLFKSGLLSLIFPELQALHGVETINGKAHKDNFYHTLEVVDNLARKSNNIWLRWAALLHDIAKPPTKRFDPRVGWTFHGHEVIGANMVTRIFKRLRLPQDHKMKYVEKLVRLHLRPISLTKKEITDSAIRRLLVDAGDELEDLMLLCEADITSKSHERRSRYANNYRMVRENLAQVEEKDKLRNWQPPVDGQQIMDTFGIGPGREVGVIKQYIRESILDGVIPDNPEAAHQLMIEKGISLGLKPIQQ
jgi:putative nucleotidyltransferase with HDIG domain